MTQKNLFSDQDKIIIIIIIIIIWTLIPLPRYSIFILKVTFENTPGRFCCNCSIMSSSWCLQWIERIYDMIIMPPFLSYITIRTSKSVCVKGQYEFLKLALFFSILWRANKDQIKFSKESGSKRIVVKYISIFSICKPKY